MVSTYRLEISSKLPEVYKSCCKTEYDSSILNKYLPPQCKGRKRLVSSSVNLKSPIICEKTVTSPTHPGWSHGVLTCVENIPFVSLEEEPAIQGKYHVKNTVIKGGSLGHKIAKLELQIFNYSILEL